MLEIVIIIAITIKATIQPSSFLCFAPFLTSQPLPFAMSPLHPALCLLSLLSPSLSEKPSTIYPAEIDRAPSPSSDTPTKCMPCVTCHYNIVHMC